MSTDAMRGPGPRTPEEQATVLAAVVASALDAVIVVDEDGLVVAMNPAAERLFGYAARDAVGQSIGALIVPDHMRDAHEGGMSRYRATGVPRVLGRRVEMPARCADGSIIPVELAITEVTLPGRRLYTANLRDLSATKAAAAEIERQRDALHQKDKLAAIGSLLAGVAHELNNPLSIVLGQAVLMREEASASGAESLLRRATTIESAAERCARVVRSFLAIARQRKGQPAEVRLADLLDGAIELMGYNLRSGGIGVERHYAAGMPDAFANADQVHQIVVNLLVNAAQALDGVTGRRSISVRLESGLDGMLSVVVDDSGPGIARHDRERIFDPFFTTKPVGSGTGIGLSVSRGLAEAQGGRLSLVESRLGGAAFELLIPAAGAASATEHRPATPSSDEAAAPSLATTARRRALVVDDEPEIAALMVETLRSAGFDCVSAGGGRQAQDMVLRDATFHVIICDLRMPDIDGQALYAWLLLHHPELAARTVFVTGDSLGPVAGRFLAASGRPVLEKPFAPSDLVRLVDAF